MLHYELLLSARTLLNPRQLLLRVSSALDGPQLASVLDEQVPGTRWYVGSTPLADLGTLVPGRPLLLADVPGPGFAASAGSTRLKLFVPEGPDAGAWMELERGAYDIGRGAPLRLGDPQVSRVHAHLLVDERSLRVRRLADSGCWCSPTGVRCRFAGRWSCMRAAGSSLAARCWRSAIPRAPRRVRRWRTASSSSAYRRVPSWAGW